MEPFKRLLALTRGMPGPSSRTLSITRPSPARAETSTAPPGGENETASSSRVFEHAFELQRVYQRTSAGPSRA